MVASKRLLKLVVVAVVSGTVLVLNPWFGLTADSFHFAARELRAAVEGTWQATHTTAEGRERTITFTLAQGGAAKPHHSARAWIRSAAACGHRSLVKAAHACASFTDMPLEVVLLAATGPQPQAEQATFVVDGNDFTIGSLSASLGELSIRAMITPGGEAREVRISAKGAASDLVGALVRTRR
jgi:hypothetical protein